MKQKLYVIEAEERKCKIGISENPLKRLAQLEGAGGFRAKSFFYTEVDNCEGAERRLLDIFSDERVTTSTNTKSEWVKAEFVHVLIEAIKQKFLLVLHIDDNLSLYFKDIKDPDAYLDCCTEIEYDPEQGGDWLISGEDDYSFIFYKIVENTINVALRLVKDIYPHSPYLAIHGAHRIVQELAHVKKAIEALEKTIVTHCMSIIEETQE